jgi:E3 ubiquitin-protein ligase HERC3
MRRVLFASLALLSLACGKLVDSPATTNPPESDGGESGEPAPAAPAAVLPPPSDPCADDRRDGAETDVDCGGSACSRCADGKTCIRDTDCRGGRCSGGRCRSLVVDVASGSSHSCALLGGGSVKCWGRNDRGQLGLGDREPRGTTIATIPSSLPDVDLGKKRFAIAIACGSASSCAVLEGGAVTCWGANVGTSGPGTNLDRGIYPEQMGENLPVLDMGTGRHVQSISAGMDHWCAVLDDSSVKCWGNDFNGRVGIGQYLPIATMGDARPAIRLGTGRTAKAVTAGGTHTCALLDDSSVKCWGSNSVGQLGLGPVGWRGTDATQMGDDLATVNLGTGRRAKSIRAGYAHTCAILDDGTLRCWGANSSGQLGLGDSIPRGTSLSEMGDALPVVDLGAGRSPRELGLGPSASHTCVLLDDASVKCFGWNAGGQLGAGDTVTRGTSPADVPSVLLSVDLGAGLVTSVAVGGEHNCVMLGDGSVKCWGSNDFGELGLGDTSARGAAPGQMGAPLGPVRIVSP